MKFDHEGATFCRPNCCAGSLVLETGLVHNVTTDCSEEELVYNADVDDKAMTISKWSTSEIDSEEESGTSTNKGVLLLHHGLFCSTNGFVEV